MASNSISVAAALESSGAGLRLGLAYHTQTHHMLRCRVEHACEGEIGHQLLRVARCYGGFLRGQACRYNMRVCSIGMRGRHQHCIRHCLGFNRYLQPVL